MITRRANPAPQRSTFNGFLASFGPPRPATGSYPFRNHRTLAEVDADEAGRAA